MSQLPIYENIHVALEKGINTATGEIIEDINVNASLDSSKGM